MTHKCKVYQHSHLKANEETLIIPQRDALGFKNSCSISSRKLSKICPINDWWIFNLLDCILISYSFRDVNSHKMAVSQVEYG